MVLTEKGYICTNSMKKKINDSLSQKLLQLKLTLPSQVLADHFELRPDMAQNYTTHQKEHFKKDVAWILSFLGEAVWAENPILFD